MTVSASSPRSRARWCHGERPGRAGGGGRRHATALPALRRTRPDAGGVPADPRAARAAAHRPGTRAVLGDVERALLLQVLPAAPAPVRGQGAANEGGGGGGY